MDALKIERAIIGGFDRGEAADIMAAPWPERCKVSSLSADTLLVAGHRQNAAAASSRAPVVSILFCDRARSGWLRRTVARLQADLAAGLTEVALDDATFDRRRRSTTRPRRHRHPQLPLAPGLADGETRYDDLNAARPWAPPSRFQLSRSKVTAMARRTDQVIRRPFVGKYCPHDHGRHRTTSSRSA
jgi:hypothetical protein